MGRGKKNPLTWQDPNAQKSGHRKPTCVEHSWRVSGVKGSQEYLECRNCDAVSQRPREA